MTFEFEIQQHAFEPLGDIQATFNNQQGVGTQKRRTNFSAVADASTAIADNTRRQMAGDQQKCEDDSSQHVKHSTCAQQEHAPK